MLGLSKKGTRWIWNAAGKHPALRDYFFIGKETPFSKAFSSWIEQGYNNFSVHLKRQNRMGSWRFWAKTPDKNTLIVGLIRESCDSIGRPYPLLIMGEGNLPRWEKHWELIPAACERPWIQMEYISTKNYTDMKQLREDLQSLPVPSLERVSLDQPSLHDQVDASLLNRIHRHVKEYCMQDELMATLREDLSGDMASLVEIWHIELKAQAKVVPKAVFIGGIPGRNLIAAFARALRPKDFIKIWSMDCSTG